MARRRTGDTAKRKETGVSKRTTAGESETVETRAPAEVGQEGPSRRQATYLLLAGYVHLGVLR